MEDMVAINFDYVGDSGKVTNRYVQAHHLGTSEAGNLMISGYQAGGGTDGKTVSGWKQFHIGKIVDGSVKLTNFKYHKPISDIASFDKSDGIYNPTGNKNMRGNITMSNFNKYNNNK